MFRELRRRIKTKKVSFGFAVAFLQSVSCFLLEIGRTIFFYVFVYSLLKGNPKKIINPI